MNKTSTPYICEQIFFALSCVSIFTCVLRADWNFAIGILCYYIVKSQIRDNNDQQKLLDASRKVSSHSSTKMV